MVHFTKFRVQFAKFRFAFHKLTVHFTEMALFFQAVFLRMFTKLDGQNGFGVFEKVGVCIFHKVT